jgi:hypothetical protein
MLRKILPLLFTLGLFLAGPAQAEGVGKGAFGAGIQTGFPGNGFSFNWFLAEQTSLQVDATLWLRDDWTGLGARVDYLWWMPELKRWPYVALLWYWGPGGNLFSWSYSGKGSADGYLGLGAELPVGLGLRFTKVPIDVNLEAVPVLQILGSGGTDVDLAIAGVLNARYYF